MEATSFYACIKNNSNKNMYNILIIIGIITNYIYVNMGILYVHILLGTGLPH